MTPYENGIHSTHQVFFEDSVPQLFTGWRGIVLVSIGPKWVKFTVTVTGQRVRVKRAIWDQLKVNQCHPH